MVSNRQKRKSPSRRKVKKTGSSDQKWLLPAALAMVFAGGIAAVLWPNPKKPDVADHVISSPKENPAPGPKREPAQIPEPENEASLAPEVTTAPLVAGTASEAAEPKQAKRPEIVKASGKPRIAIVLDDIGLDQKASRRAAELPGPITLAYLPYASNLPAQAAFAKAQGHELIVHIPMEPMSAATNPGPNALRVDLPSHENLKRFDESLKKFEGFVGFNNHMGSRFTANRAAMQEIMAEAQARGLIFLDSRTTPKTVGAELAQQLGVAYAVRDVFLDNERKPDAIRSQLNELAAQARRNGSAIGIGHPYPETLNVLSEWLQEAKAAGYELVPVSSLVKEPAIGQGS